MPSLDMTEVLVSPEFQDTFTFVSSSRTINAFGVAIDNTPVVTTALGIVIPDPSSLDRQSDGSRTTTAIDIYTRVMMTDGYSIDTSNSQNADVITWNGRRYVVEAVSDFSNYGQGFIHVNAVMIDISTGTDSQGDSSGG